MWNTVNWNMNEMQKALLWVSESNEAHTDMCPFAHSSSMCCVQENTEAEPFSWKLRVKMVGLCPGGEDRSMWVKAW